MDNYKFAKGWLTADERETLKHYAELAQTESNRPLIINIGVEYGASLHCFRAGSLLADIVGVDLDVSKLDGDPRAELIAGDSTDKNTADQAGEACDILFVDGGHAAGNVTDDIRLWSPKVIKGGIMLFHDYSPLDMHSGVVQAVDTWYSKNKKNWEFIEQVDTIRVYLRK